MIYEAWKKIDKAPPFGELNLFPSIDREKLDESVRGRIKEEAESALRASWPRLTASLYREFRLNGNRAKFEGLCFERMRIVSSLFWGEYIEMKGRYSSCLLDAVWSICEQSSWVLPAHNQVRNIEKPDLPDADEPIVALLSAQTAANLALILHYLRGAFEEFSPLFIRRVERELKIRVIEPYLTRDDLWWMGLSEIKGKVNNWNPWINSNVLLVTLLTERAPDIRKRVLEKVCLTLDRFLDVYGPDGGCDEGCTYWNKAGGSLFDCLEILNAACGLDVFSEPLIGEIGRFLYRMQINGPWFVNFADGAARIRINAALVYLYGRRIGDASLQALGLEAFDTLESEYLFHGNIYDRLRAFGVYGEAVEAIRRRDAGAGAGGLYPRVSWLPHTEAGAVREKAGTAEGFFLAFKGGHNAESHNHNDVGSFLVSCRGGPVLIDVGVETYKAKTFGPRRYEIWTMQSSYHNLPEIGGCMQRHGGQYRALEVRFVPADPDNPEGIDRFSLDLAGAYGEEASVIHWKREIALNRKERAVQWEEDFAFGKVQPFQLNMITPWKPLETDRSGRLTLFNGPEGGDAFYGVEDPARLTCTYPSELTVEVEEIILEDEKLLAVWPERIYRIILGGRAREGTLRFDLRAADG